MAATAVTSEVAPRPEMYFDSPGAALVRANDLDWIGDGINGGIKLLRISSETGWFAALIKGRAGQVNPPHTHIGPCLLLRDRRRLRLSGRFGACWRLGVGTGRRSPSGHQPSS